MTASPAKSQTLRVAGIGTGGIFKSVHIKPLVDHPEVEVVALCDVVEEKAQQLADEYGVKQVFTDYRDVLKLEDVDAVDICTSNKFHSEIAVAALEAGKHVFCEKPDAINASEAQKMADAAKKSGKTLMVMRNNRFRPDTQYLKQYIDAGKMGEIYTGRCGWQRRRGIPGKGGWFTTKELSGGGPLIDLGVHMIDVAIWLMGNPRPVAVTGCTYCKFAEAEGPSDSIHSQFGEAKADGTFDVEDLAIGFIRFDNGASLQIEFSWASNVEAENIFVELRGTKAGSSIGHGQEMRIFGEEDGALVDITPKPVKLKVQGHAANLHHFIDVVHGRAKPIFKPEDGVDMIKILTALYESADTGREVAL